MDEMTTSGIPTGVRTPSTHTGSSDPAPGERQPRLPFEQTPVVALPYDDEADAPIDFALTTQARRAVAPHELPDLRVVPPAHPGAGDPDDPSDTRPARARALRRAGLTPTAIAAKLEVDDLLVRAWIDDVRVGRRRGGGAPSAEPGTARSLAAVGPGPGTDPDAGPDDARAAADDRQRRVTEAYERCRHEHRHTARRRLAEDPAFAAEVGLLAAIGEVEPAAVTLHGPRAALLGRALRGLVTEAAVDRGRVRVVLRIGPQVAGDLARHRWAEALALSAERIVVTRWAQAPTGDAVDALVRIPDPGVAAQVAGWTDALLDGPDQPLGLAF